MTHTQNCLRFLIQSDGCQWGGAAFFQDKSQPFLVHTMKRRVQSPMVNKNELNTPPGTPAKSPLRPTRLQFGIPPQSPDHSNPALDDEPKDTMNYALLIVLYTLQGIPMGLSASIPFLIQQKVRFRAAQIASEAISSPAAAAAASSAAASLSYNANAIFALCSWPFSLKLLWAPIVDAVFIRKFGRRKSWLIPTQTIAGLLMVLGSNFVERQLSLGSATHISESFNVNGVTAFFFVLYFLMATQDIAVDGWALTMVGTVSVSCSRSCTFQNRVSLKLHSYPKRIGVEGPSVIQ
jgi:hypothetical protein